jgi:hypothetical protein
MRNSVRRVALAAALFVTTGLVWALNPVPAAAIGPTETKVVCAPQPPPAAPGTYACQVEVHDTDPQPPGDLTCPSGGMPDPWQEHGRGLLLIRTLSSSCGHRPTESGKAVWFRLPVVPAQRRPSA